MRRQRRTATLLGLLLLVAGVLAGCGTYDRTADTKTGQQPQGAALRITLGTVSYTHLTLPTNREV